MSTIKNNSPKQQMLAILQDQPDDSSFNELLRGWLVDVPSKEDYKMSIKVGP